MSRRGQETTPRPRRQHGRRNSNEDDRQYVCLVKEWEPQSRDDAMIMDRFTEAPRPPPLHVVMNGHSIAIPRYNGVAWWFPQQIQHPAERFFFVLFTVVNVMQTLCLFVWPAMILYRVGIVWAIPTLVVSVPMGVHLEDRYGPNYGTAYSSLNALRWGLYVLQKGLLLTKSNEQQETAPNPLIVAAGFCVIVVLVGKLMALVEKYVLGRTWNAAVVAYAELLYWMYSGFALYFKR